MTNANAKANRGIGDKVLDWFIVREDEDDPSASEPPESPPTRRSASEPGRRPTAPPPLSSLAPSPSVDDAERERLAKVVALVETLPAEAPADVKRAILAASLEAFGVSIDRILATGEAALAALDAQAEDGQARTRERLAASEARIAELNAEITDVRRQMDEAVAAQDARARGVAGERSRLVSVLDFFGRQATAGSARLVRLR
jgi:hypothetical protein